MADSPVLYVYYRPDNDDAYPGVPARHITEADWARFSPSQRRIVQEATTQDGYGRRKVWVHIDLVDETEQERAEREAREQAAREAYERGNSLVRYREIENILDQMDAMPDAEELQQLRNDVDTVRGEVGVITGVVDDDTTDNTAAIQAAVNQGGRWTLPRTTGRYYVAGEIDLTVPGTELHLWGAPIRQGPHTLFRALAPDLLIDGLDSTGTDGQPDFSGMNTSWEGSITASRWCAVNIYANAHRLRIPWIRGRGMSSVVRSGGWDTATNSVSSVPTEDIEIGTILCERVEFGTALRGTTRIKIGDVRGTYGDTATMPRPPHLLYFADGGAGHHDITVLSAVAQGGANGHAFQFKGIDGGTIGTLFARNCAGAMNVMGVRDVTIAEVTSWGDTFNGTQGGAVTFAVDASPNSSIHIGRMRLDMAVNKTAFHIIDGDHITVDDLDLTVHHTTTGSGTEYDVTVSGHHNVIRRVRVVNTGPNAWRAVGIWGTGEGNRIGAEELSGVRIGLDGRTSPDAIFEYDADRITLHDTDGMYALTASTSTGRTRFLAPQTVALRDRAVVADNFTVGSLSAGIPATALTGQAWTLPVGSWRIANRQSFIAADLAGARAFIDPGTTAHRVSVEVTHAVSNGPVIKATADLATYLWIKLQAGGVDIAIGNGAALASYAKTMQSGRVYRIDATYYDGVVDVALDGVAVLSHTLTPEDAAIFNPATVVGLRTSHAATRFANLRVQAIG